MYHKHKKQPWKLWLLFDDRTLKFLDALRERVGPLTVNDWWWGGNFQYRGFREHGCGWGSETSQHYFGRAIDCTSAKYTAQELRDLILAGTLYLGHYVKGVEKDVSWLHFDMRNMETIQWFKPS